MSSIITIRNLLNDVLLEEPDSVLIDNLIQSFPTLFEFMNITYPQIINKLNISSEKARQITSIVTLIKELYKDETLDKVIKTPLDIVESFLYEYRYKSKEHFIGVFLNTKNRIIHKEIISIGSLNASIVHPREVFNAAIRHCSASLICVHNHPSGDPNPSQEDIQTTKRLVEAGNIIGIDVLDHIIIGENRYYSLKEHGHM